MFISTNINECVKVYEDVIQKLAELIYKIGISKDPVKIYETFVYMFRNGYLSYNGISCDVIPKRYINLELERYIEMDITGLILFCGFGVCRHQTNFLYHLFQALGYDASQVFTYSPDLEIKVDVNDGKFRTNSTIQEFIDQALIGFDLFSREESHFTREFGEIIITINYRPQKHPYLANHTINVVVDKKGILHILDASHHCIGERIDKDILKMNKHGFTHLDFIQRNISFDSHYGTNYYKGLGLLEHETNIGYDMLTSTLYEEECKEYIELYEKFQADNKKNYTKVVDTVYKLMQVL